MRQSRFARVATLLASLLVLDAIGGFALGQDAGPASAMSAWTQRDQVRAFYSGHSLSDGVPEAVELIARSLGQRLNFEVQSQGYSLLRQRTKGENPAATDWPGYRAGNNRRGSGLNVAEELRKPQRLPAGEKYDVLVVTERHDLPGIARRERTAFYLAEIAKQLVAGNPDGEILFYHTWLNLDPNVPWPWIDYERAVAPMWECLASRANLDLPKRGDTPRVRVLPGGSALAELAAALWDGKVPGIQLAAPGARVKLLFSDQVHMTDMGRYYMALVHYAVLFGRSPEGAFVPKFMPLETGRYMQALAWQFASSYGQVANAAATRDMAACRTIMQEDVCPASAAFQQGTRLPLMATLKRQLNSYYCKRDYTDADDSDNPFAAPK